MHNQLPTRSSLWLYAPLWIFFVYLYIQILSFNQGAISNIFLGGMYFVQFGVHEAGHIVFGFLPAVIVAAAGSGSELAFTILLAIAAFRAKAYFAGIFGLLWVMLACASVGTYMADARAQLMPLIGPSGDPQHDWNFVFGQLGLLDADIAIGTTVKVIGGIVGAVALLLGLLLLIAMAGRSKSAKQPL